MNYDEFVEWVQKALDDFEDVTEYHPQPSVEDGEEELSEDSWMDGFFRYLEERELGMH